MAVLTSLYNVLAIKNIVKYDESKKKRYIAALECLGSVAIHSEIIKLANSFRVRQNTSLKNQWQAKGLANLSEDSEIEHAELAKNSLKLVDVDLTNLKIILKQLRTSEL